MKLATVIYETLKFTSFEYLYVMVLRMQLTTAYNAREISYNLHLVKITCYTYMNAVLKSLFCYSTTLISDALIILQFVYCHAKFKMVISLGPLIAFDYYKAC